MTPLHTYINKEIPFRFAGEDFRFSLSHGLFSSNSVDAGTLLLLKSLAHPATDNPPESILDVGCGTGILGICLKRKYPEARVVLQDRDALATAFSRLNSEENHTPVEVREALLGETLEGERFHLVVSNIPAKAGPSVLEKFFPSAGDLVLPGGFCAVVIVSTLSGTAERILKESGMTVLYRDDSRQHTVFHYRPETPLDRPPPELPDYIRGQGKFRLGENSYRLSTAYNIPDFDTLGYRLKNAGRIMDRVRNEGDLLFWAPGQGHLPVALTQRGRSRVRSVRLAGRDLLELRISEHNLAENGWRGEVPLIPCPAPEILEDRYPDSADLFVCDIAPVPGSDWAVPLKRSALKILRPGGQFLLIGESGDLQRFYRDHKGFSPLADYRNRGSRCVLFARNS